MDSTAAVARKPPGFPAPGSTISPGARTSGAWLGRLFKSGMAPLTVTQWKEIYDLLDTATVSDPCEMNSPRVRRKECLW